MDQSQWKIDACGKTFDTLYDSCTPTHSPFIVMLMTHVTANFRERAKGSTDTPVWNILFLQFEMNTYIFSLTSSTTATK